MYSLYKLGLLKTKQIQEFDILEQAKAEIYGKISVGYGFNFTRLLSVLLVNANVL